MFPPDINTGSLLTETKMHPSQRDIFTDQLINVASPHYNIGLYIKLKGELNIEEFTKAVTLSPEVLDVFKMRFDTASGDFSSYINVNYSRFEMTEQDFSHTKNPEKSAKGWMQQQYNTAFELQKENLLFEQSLLKIADDEHWFFFRFHHIITDAFGCAVWVNYLSHRYVSLIYPTKQFSFDYPSYLHEANKASQYYHSKEYKLTDQYWKNKIKEKPRNLIRKKHVNTTGRISANFFLEVDQSTRQRLSELQATTSSNLQQLTIAAFLIYLKKTSSEPDYTLAIPYHKRGLDGQRNMMGMFSGILPLKQSIEEDLTVADLIKSIKNSIREDYAYRYYLIGDLSRNLKLGLSDNYLCDVVINYVPFNFDLNFGEKIAADIHWLSSEYEKSPLQICWRNYSESQPLELGLHFGLEYFDNKEIELFANRIIYILLQLSSSLEKNISSISILPDKERAILKGFNETAVILENNKTIVSAFKEQAGSNPHHIAVTCGQERCSYRQLDERSNQLAHYLLKKGVKKETLVPICIGRSIDMITGILGVLKAGAAYVPVDPKIPEERIRHILNDIGADIILSSKKISSNIFNSGIVTPIFLDDDWLKISQEISDCSLPEVTQRDLAYVIYTSGSTGQPKGVMIEHGSYMNINNFYYRISPGEQTSLTCNYVFDVSVLEIFSSLLGGGCLNIPPYSTTADPNIFAEFLYDKKISTAYIHPMHLAQVSTVLSGYNNSYLKRILIGVEPIGKDVVKWYLEKNIQVVNGYGPTETSICATFYLANSANIYSLLPIGKPIANYEVFIVDKNEELVPVGVAGEIYIGGAGLARGYLNRPGLTEEKFIKNIFSADTNARLYKTGDVGRWLTDGNIEYIGRIDNQVKIRGYRIELGEIESALLQSKLVKECVVIAAADNEGQKRLTGYVVPHATFDREAIVSYLKSRLPDYMVPAIWVHLKSLPFTANGKVDRKALPEPGSENVAIEKYTAPQTDLEIKLSAIWQKLLRLKKIGIHDNFFNLGGHSVIAVHLMIRLEKEVGIILPISVLSAHSTIAALSLFINLNENKKQWKSLVSLKSSGTRVPLYIVHGAGLNVLIFKYLAEHLDADQPVYGLQAKGLDGITEPLDKIEDIAAFYISEMLQQNPHGPYAIAGYSSGGVIAFEMAKQLREMNKEVTIVAMFDSFAYSSDRLKPAGIKYWNKIKTDSLKIIYTFIFLFQEPRLIAKYKVEFIKRSWSQLIGKLGKNRTPVDKYYIFTKNISDKLDSAIYNYRITSYDGMVDVFRARKRTYYIPDFKFLGWKPFASKGVKVHDVPGEHKDLLLPPNVKVFARILQDALDGK